jgi:hypothetical protein
MYDSADRRDANTTFNFALHTESSSMGMEGHDSNCSSMAVQALELEICAPPPPLDRAPAALRLAAAPPLAPVGQRCRPAAGSPCLARPRLNIPHPPPRRAVKGLQVVDVTVAGVPYQFQRQQASHSAAWLQLFSVGVSGQDLAAAPLAVSVTVAGRVNALCPAQGERLQRACSECMPAAACPPHTMPALPTRAQPQLPH